MSVTNFGELKTALANFGHRSDLTSRIPEFVALCEDRIANGDPLKDQAPVRCRAMETQAYVVWRADQDGGTVGGTANAITLANQSGTPAVGESWTFTATAANTAATTVNAINVKKRYGGVSADLSAGDIIDDAFYRLYYDGTQWQLAPEHGALLPTDFLEQRSLYLDSASVKELDFFPPDAFWSQAYVLTTGSPLGYTIEGDWALSLRLVDTAYFAKLNYYRRFARFSADSDTNWLLTNAIGVYLYGSLLEMALYARDDNEAMKYSLLFEDAVQRVNAGDKRLRFPSAKMQMRVVGSKP